MTKYNVGDKVRVKSDLNEVEHTAVSHGMMDYAGHIVTIAHKYDDDNKRYEIKEDIGYTWYDDCFEPIEPDQTAKADVMTRASILAEAAKIVTTDREQQYGSPEDNFGIIAEYWTIWLKGRLKDGERINAHDVATMMAELKIARIQSGQVKADNYIDLAGYVACGAEIKGKESEQA